MKVRALFLSGVLLLSAQNGFSSPKGGCHNDIKKFCDKAKPGPDIKKCLEKNKESLSDECKKDLEKNKGQPGGPMGGPSEECMAEMEKYCKDIEPGPAMEECFKKNQTKFSTACQSFMKKHKGPPPHPPGE